MNTEKDLFSSLKESDNDAFEFIFRLYYQPLKAFANTIVNDLYLAEDLVQDVFIHLWNNRTTVEVSSPKAYLYNMVKNKALNSIRHNKVKQRHADEILNTTVEFISDELENNEVQIDILKAINKLPEHCKKIFIMSRMHSLKHKEIAEELNISIKTVKNQIGKALKILREDLKATFIMLIISAVGFISKIF